MRVSAITIAVVLYVLTVSVDTLSGQEAASEIEVIRDLSYATSPSHENGRGLLDVYLPAEREGAPVLIFMHGGGLSNGDKRRVQHIGRRFASEGFVTILNNYRLTPPNAHPDHIEDAAAAFAWVHQNISEYGGDPNRIFVAGGSAGGYLSALLAYDERYLARHELSTRQILAVIPIRGLVDVRRTRRRRQREMWHGDPDVILDASPIHHVRKDGPPTLILFADGDTRVRRQMNVDFAEALQSVGHPDANYMEIPDRTHNTIGRFMEEPDDPTTNAMLTFMRRFLVRP